mgnify:CR=1 FL=1
METFLLKTTNGTPFQQEMKSEILYNSCSEANTYFGSSCSKLVPRSKLEAYLVFVNPEFTLYQAPFDQSLIFPTQLKRYIQKLNMMPSKFTIRHTKLAQELISRHLPESSWERLPEYHYNQLRKGIICSSCQGFFGKIFYGVTSMPTMCIKWTGWFCSYSRCSWISFTISGEKNYRDQNI